MRQGIFKGYVGGGPWVGKDKVISNNGRDWRVPSDVRVELIVVHEERSGCSGERFGSAATVEECFGGG